MNEEKTTLAGILITGGILTFQGLRNGNLSIRTYASLALVALILIGVAQFAPKVASAFSILLLVTVLLSRGESLNQLADLANVPRIGGGSDGGGGGGGSGGGGGGKKGK